MLAFLSTARPKKNPLPFYINKRKKEDFMAGHSKWAQIKRKKGALDVKRGKLFSRLSKEIQVAARLGGGDPSLNPRLRQAVATARAESMPNDNIDNAIKKGTGEIAGGPIEEMVYEGYGPGGVALMVECATDNRNRTAAEIRSIFSKNHGNLAGSGSVAWMFHRKGLVTAPGASVSEDAILAAGLDAGIEDVRLADEIFEVVTAPDKLSGVHEALKAAGIECESSRFTYVPANTTAVTDIGVAGQLFRLLEALEDHDDVQNVHANFDMAAELMESSHA